MEHEDPIGLADEFSRRIARGEGCDDLVARFRSMDLRGKEACWEAFHVGRGLTPCKEDPTYTPELGVRKEFHRLVGPDLVKALGVDVVG